jgi:lipopolysaccharide/colanic/teichoic acid biosynthesis glycosyltransferase
MVCSTLKDLAFVEENSRNILPKILRGDFRPSIRYHGAKVKAPRRSIRIDIQHGSAGADSFLKLFLKRMFDISFASLGLVFLAPLILCVCVIVGVGSNGPIFFRQKRVGYRKKDFDIIKFRTMYVNSQENSFLTVGDNDPRVTKIGFWLRKYKIDELPQLFNVLIGDMSIVGPRPEVKKYVSLYTAEQQRVLLIKPGITDWSSIEFRNLAELLSRADDPDLYYINHVLPIKLNRSLEYLEEHSLVTDFKIIIMTVRKVIFS